MSGDREGGMRRNPDGDVEVSTRIQHGLRETYRGLAQGGVERSCCVPSQGVAPSDPDAGEVPSEVKSLALGCGDPVTLAALEPGETVLDLGCGAGGDCFRAAKRVDRSGRVIGVDMTPAMIDRARAAAERIGAENVEFRLGEIEHLPVADETSDVVMSNCVVKLSPAKVQVFREAFRVLKPGGRLALSETMMDGPLPEAVRIALGSAADGLSAEKDFVAAIEAAGFVDVSVEREKLHPSFAAEALQVLAEAGGTRARAVIRVAETGETRVVDLDGPPSTGAVGQSVIGRVRARKPGQSVPAAP